MPNRLLGKTDKMGPFRSMIYLFKMVMFNGYYDYYVKSQQRYVETCRDINYIYMCVYHRQGRRTQKIRHLLPNIQILIRNSERSTWAKDGKGHTTFI